MARGIARGFLGLGSNLGDRRANLEQACVAVGARRSSSVYESAPVGLVLDQPAFLNACVEIETDREPLELLDWVKRIERNLGREPSGVRHGPRVIDIDILLLGGREFSADRLVIPHQALTERRFVLVPLLELEPGAALPDGTVLRDALAALGDDQDVVRAGPALRASC